MRSRGKTLTLKRSRCSKGGKNVVAKEDSAFCHYDVFHLLRSRYKNIYEIDKLMILHAASKIDAGTDFRQEVSMAKHFVANSLNRIIDRAIQVHGALGYSTDTPLAGMAQNARWARFADGADEIHQMRIAEITIKAFTDTGSTRTATGDLPI